MLTRASSARFSARSQTSPDGRSSGSVRRLDRAALCPGNIATRLHFFLPRTFEHSRVERLPEVFRLLELLADFAAAIAFGFASTVATPGRSVAIMATAIRRASRRMDEQARPDPGSNSTNPAVENDTVVKRT